MAYFDKNEATKIKTMLAQVLGDTDSIQKAYNDAAAAKKTEASDFRCMMLGTYMGLLKEVLDERAQPRTAPAGTVTMPDLETLRKKYLGNAPKR